MTTNKKNLVLSIFSMLLLSISLKVQSQNIKNPITETFKVAGNCGMCEKTIEKAANKKGLVKADWDVNKKLLELTYNSKKTNSEEILKRVAYAGYDNAKYKAPDEAYAKLHECCKYERTKSTQSNKGDNKHGNHEIIKIESQEKENQLEQVYALYFDVKDALVGDNAEKAASKSKELFEAFDAVKMEKLGSKEHEAFMKDLSDLKMHAEHISKSKDVEHQREHFSKLSGDLYELMKVIKPSYPVYLDNCPMYNDGKGANWISKESAIKNPYYGSKMLTCGKVKETLK